MPVTDARGRNLDTNPRPERIVSLVPSTTESLFDLGAGDRVVGITRFCVHPRGELAAIPIVGGTKNAEPDKILALDPDLVVANCEENTQAIFDALDPHVPVWAAFPRTVDQAIADLVDLATLVHADASTWIDAIATTRRTLHAARRPFTYAYLIWRAPWMTVSADTFIAAMLAEAGGTNVFADHPDRFPTVDASALRAADPDRVLLSSEPFPFREPHRRELIDATGLPEERFAFVDGELVSWHGTRMALGLAYLASAEAMLPP